MTKIDITKTELVWPGKYNEDGTLKEVPRVSLPFQVIETVNESRATREVKEKEGGSLFDTYKGTEGDTFEDGWKNKLIWGDNLLVMGSLLEKFAGKIDLIYIDPPFATGADFSFTTEIGESGEEVFKEQSLIEEKAYRDTWGRGMSSYIEMLYSRLVLMRELVSRTGSIYVHVDPRVDFLVRMLLDDVFGQDQFRNQVIWSYRTGGATQRTWSQKHDTILFFTKSEDYAFHTQKEKSYTKSASRKPGVVNYGAGTAEFFEDEQGVYNWVIARDVWDIPYINSQAEERVQYPTQKPEALLQRIIEASSDEGALVADFFCGSGTTLAVA